MKNIGKIVSLFAGSVFLVSCSDFDEVNTDSKAANSDQIEVEYILNDCITGAQMDPDISERTFVLSWKAASRQCTDDGWNLLPWGNYNDGFNDAYYNKSSTWLKSVNLAIKIADEKTANGTAKPYNNNLKQVARIWRAYLMSEFADSFGSLPKEGFQGVNPEFSDVKTIYYYLLDELKDAVSQIDPSITNNDESFTKLDRAYKFNFSKWIKYANSLRLRLAMRLSEVDPSKAQSEFEDAAKKDLILTADDQFKVAERPGWDNLSGVMTREWSTLFLTPTMNNIFVGLGSIETSKQLDASYAKYVKSADWIGEKYSDHLSVFTNDPAAGFLYDGLHPVIDPRAYVAYSIPGDLENTNFSLYPSWTIDAQTVKRDLVDGSGKTVKTIDASFTWNVVPIGDMGEKGSKNKAYDYIGTNVRLGKQFRESKENRIFFAEWETYFLFAEAAVRGWATPMNAKAAYEDGVKSSFTYWNVSQFVDEYLASSSYNWVGTSVKWEHTAEASASVIMKYKDGYTGIEGSYTRIYPENTIYKNGTVNNDALTKIITQKYIAQNPWLPLEAWSDHRRLGLPFFENPVVEKPIIYLPDLTQANCKSGNSIKYFPQRMKYPSSLQNSNPEGYKQAVELLGGKDNVSTPLWWAQH